MAPTPMPLSTWPGIHSAQKAGCEPDPLVVPEVGRGPDERPGHDEDAVAVALGQRPEARRDERGHDRAGHQGEAGLQHVVAPDVLQPQDVGQQVGVEAEARGHRCGRTEVERAQAQQGRVEHRRPVAPRADHEQHQRDGGADERAEHLRAGPAPVAALDDAQVEQGQADHEQGRADEVGHRAPARAPGSRPARGEPPTPRPGRRAG